MKKAMFVLACIALVILSGCRNEKPYGFNQDISEITGIEIVEAESSLEYTVIKTLSETEMEEFLEQFQTVKFGRYVFGDPMSVSGRSVKITYQDGNYEMICYRWAEYIKNGSAYFTWRFCDKEVLEGLIDKFTD